MNHAKNLTSKVASRDGSDNDSVTGVDNNVSKLTIITLDQAEMKGASGRLHCGISRSSPQPRAQFFEDIWPATINNYLVSCQGQIVYRPASYRDQFRISIQWPLDGALEWGPGELGARWPRQRLAREQSIRAAASTSFHIPQPHSFDASGGVITNASILSQLVPRQECDCTERNASQRLKDCTARLCSISLMTTTLLTWTPCSAFLLLFYLILLSYLTFTDQIEEKSYEYNVRICHEGRGQLHHCVD